MYDFRSVWSMEIFDVLSPILTFSRPPYYKPLFIVAYYSDMYLMFYQFFMNFYYNSSDFLITAFWYVSPEKYKKAEVRKSSKEILQTFINNRNAPKANRLFNRGFLNYIWDSWIYIRLPTFNSPMYFVTRLYNGHRFMLIIQLRPFSTKIEIQILKSKFC